MTTEQGDLFERMRQLGEGRAAHAAAGDRLPSAGRRRHAPAGGATKAVPAGETREGVVERVRYEAPAGDFRVLSVRVGSDLQTWAGKTPAVAAGQGVSATGQWTSDGKHGPQFSVANLTALMPSTEDGIRHFLVALGVKGLGPKTVDKIVAHFGPEVEAALDQPLLLARVRGVTGDLAPRITEAWQGAKAERAVEIQLQQFGASSLFAGRIREHYQKAAKDPVEVVRQNPYRLALDVDGIGFTTADAIAIQMGVGADSPQRVQAGVLHVLDEMTTKGHAYVRRSELVAKAAEILEVNETKAEGAIAWLSDERKVVVERAGDHEAVFPANLYRAETTVAARLAKLLAMPATAPLEAEPGAKASALDALADAAIAAFEKEAGMQLAAAQRQAVHMAAQSKVLVITGGPGVGKSATCLALLRLWQKAKLAVTFGAPTGRAAKRLAEATGQKATTIHRMLKWDPSTKAFEHNRGNPIRTNVLLLDEASMIDVSLAAQFLEAVPDGARVVFVGDVDQLPSVGPGAVLRDVIASGAVPTVRLTEIFRQAKGSTISVNAALINAGETPVGDEGIDGAFYWRKVAVAADAQAEILSLVTDRIPRTFGIPREDIQVLTPMHKHELGTIELNARLQALLNPGEGGLKIGGAALRVGDRVIVTKNDRDLDVSNGDIGKVAAVDPDDKDAVVSVEVDGRIVSFPRDKAGTISLAYAMSAHKSQGGQFACVVIALSMQHYMLLTRNLLYTAATRGKKLVVLVADPKAVRMALSAARKDDRNTRLAERLSAAVRA